MKTHSYREKWDQVFERDKDCLLNYEEMFPLWDNWERNVAPEQYASRMLGNAFDLLYAGNPASKAEYFSRRAVAIVDRALAEGKFSQGRCEVSFPGNRGEALQVRAYAYALLGDPLCEAELRQAIDDRRVWLNDFYTPGLWSDIGEGRVLSTARMAMILGDWGLVSSVIPFKYKIKHRREEMELLLQVKNQLRDEGQPLPSDLATRFTEYFERVRDPAPNYDSFAELDMARFELGAIYCLHVAPVEPFSWERVIREIAK